MRHRVQSKHFNRDSNNRKALLKNLVISLIQGGEIQTTQAKAKAVKSLTDKLVAKAQQGSISTRRTLAKFFGKRDVVNDLVDRVAPAMSSRKTGYTRISPVGKRQGDNAMMVKIELVEKPPARLPETIEQTRTKIKTNTTADKPVKVKKSKVEATVTKPKVKVAKKTVKKNTN